MRNKNFEAALAFVREHYADMFHPSLRAVNLVRNNGVNYGRFWPTTVRRNSAGLLELWEQPVITITNKRRPVHDFVNTLVHELTHLAQHVEGRPFCEREAENAGYAAARRYLQ
jgi:hypothetical protein